MRFPAAISSETATRIPLHSPGQPLRLLGAWLPELPEPHRAMCRGRNARNVIETWGFPGAGLPG